MRTHPAMILVLIVTIISMSGCTGYYDEEPDTEYTADYAEEPAYDEPDPLDVGMFGELRYYGSWHHLPPYGWVWQPMVVSDWRPFLHGHWAWTEYGWMWVSYEPFGWATSYYGNWTYDFALGWIWVPAFEWSPCRVQWIIYDDYVCWAPIPPPGVRFGDPWSNAGIEVWISIPGERFTDGDVGRYLVRPKFKSRFPSPVRDQAPDTRTIEGFTRRPVRKVLVELERTRFGDREFARVKLPPDEERVVERYKSREAKEREAVAPPAGPRTPAAKAKKSGAPKQKSRASRPKKFKEKDEPEREAKEEKPQ